MSSSQSEERTRDDTSNQKVCDLRAKIPAFYRRLRRRFLQRRFADIQRETFFSQSFSRTKGEKHLGNWSGIVSFVSLSMKKTVESRQNNSGRGKTERDVSLSCAFNRSYFVFHLSLYSNHPFLLKFISFSIVYLEQTVEVTCSEKR